MFDIGFWELVIIFGLGLMVLGPERLPRVAAKVGRWAGQARNMARHLSDQLREEIEPVQSQFDSVRSSVENEVEGVTKDWSAKRPEPGAPSTDNGDDSKTDDANDTSKDNAA